MGLGLLGWSLAICPPPAVEAAPPGKAWTAVEGMQEPGYDWLVGPRLELSPAGSPRLYVRAVAYFQGFSEAFRYDWSGSTWEPAHALGVEPTRLVPVDAPVNEYPLLFIGGKRSESRKLFWAEDLGDDVTTPEHIATTIREYEQGYSGATRGGRRWAAIQDNFENNGFLRLFLSDQTGVWEELPIDDPASGGLAMLALDDTTALLVWDREQVGQGLGWGIVRGRQWLPEVNPVVPQHQYQSIPRLRAHPEGGGWLTHASGTTLSTVPIRRFENGTWGAPEELHCNYTGGEFGPAVGWAEMSHDAAPRPVVAWSFDDFVDGSGGICVCIPDENGWGLGDEVFSGGYGATNAVTRDRNGDAWVAWGRYPQPLRWTHTYTTAIPGAPEVSIATGRPALAWTLSTPAPGSWWAVERQIKTGAFEDVARVQAGPAAAMSWIDEAYRPGPLLRDGVSYRIRRECVDTRYEFLSPVGTWSPGHRGIRLAVRQPSLGGDGLLLEVAEAIGSRLDLTIFDVSGRAVQRRQLTLAAGTAPQTFPLTSGVARLPAGVYFARVRDESGATSPGVKFVQLR